MVTLTEGIRNASFLVSEANGMYRSREKVTVTVPSGGIAAGTVLGAITASGKYVRHDSGLSNGAETEAGILYETLTAAGDAEVTIIARDAEVVGAHLTYEDGADAAAITASNTALASLGIIVR
ncbi:head decoration protein [Acuticoccus sp. M5D2P5]|uniref:head decoration protein n=1 Tax=Acuticoccus kalidii TaxID=2910977 RepID=UPI001F2772AD|nr:head decoration protein [Acuticoccus kalidii]MCF3934339.1 head decoration protein [Acuticoccus kalidii]